MTSADDFVLQLIQDKGLVPPDIVKLGREQLVSEGVSPSDIDSKLIDLLVEKRYCKYEDISYQLSQEFNIPLLSLQDIRVDAEVLQLPQKRQRIPDFLLGRAARTRHIRPHGYGLRGRRKPHTEHVGRPQARQPRGNTQGHRRPLRRQRLRRHVRRRAPRGGLRRRHARDRQRSWSLRGRGAHNPLRPQAHNRGRKAQGVRHTPRTARKALPHTLPHRRRAH